MKRTSVWSHYMHTCKGAPSLYSYLILLVLDKIAMLNPTCEMWAMRIERDHFKATVRGALGGGISREKLSTCIAATLAGRITCRWLESLCKSINVFATPARSQAAAGYLHQCRQSTRHDSSDIHNCTEGGHRQSSTPSPCHARHWFGSWDYGSILQQWDKHVAI